MNEPAKNVWPEIGSRWRETKRVSDFVFVVVRHDPRRAMVGVNADGKFRGWARLAMFNGISGGYRRLE